ELLGLRWADISHNRRVVTLHMTKNGERREVPLSGRAYDALNAWRQRQGEINHDRVFPLSVGGLEQIWSRLLVRARIADLRFHDLRHESVSRLFERGLNVIEVSSISGHKELRMLRRYSHLRAEDLVARLS